MKFSTIARLALVVAPLAAAAHAESGVARRVAHLQVPPQIVGQTALGPLARGTRLGLTVTLPIRDMSGLEQLVRDQADPHSPQFMHYLSVDQYADRFGATPEQIQAVTDYFTRQGLTVTTPLAGRHLLRLEGPVERVENAFDVKVNRYRIEDREVYSNDRDPSLPASLDLPFEGVTGLNNVLQAQPMDGGKAPFTPIVINRAYNFDALHNAGFNGQGQTVAICSFADYSDANLAYYAAHVLDYASPAHAPIYDPSHIVRVPIDGGNTNYDGEADLDTELCIGTVPSATVLIYEAPNNSNEMREIFDTFVFNTDPGAASVMSCSWGFAESGFLPNYGGYLDQFNNILISGAAMGRTIFTSSGDNGSTLPNVKSSNGVAITTPTVSFPASASYMAGIGGTSLFVNARDQYGHESAWGGTNTNGTTFGSGGGRSAHFTRPAWQTGPGISPSETMRLVPDISLDANPSTGYAVPLPNGSLIYYGGTSASAPEWAAGTLLIQQAVGRSFFLPPVLYNIFNAVNGGAPFHDVTSGNNGAYACAAGFDLVTGIGTADFGALSAKILTLIGDADQSGTYDMADVVLALQEAGGLTAAPTTQVVPLTTDPVLRGDVDGDGFVTLNDAAIMLRHLNSL